MEVNRLAILCKLLFVGDIGSQARWEIRKIGSGLLAIPIFRYFRYLIVMSWFIVVNVIIPAAGAMCLVSNVHNDTLAERLRRRPAKPMGSPRVGSNPTGVVLCDV